MGLMDKTAVRVTLLVAALFVLGAACRQAQPAPTAAVPQDKQTAIFESSAPAHQSRLAGVPVNIVVDVNQDLIHPSVLSIVKDGQEYGTGVTVIDDNQLAMRTSMRAEAPDGQYTVKYKTCIQVQSPNVDGCEDGQLVFSIDRRLAETFTDRRNQSTVNVELSNIQFQPQNLRISNGTKVVWTNDEDVGHYVNTDSHPAHTFFTAQNSELLNKGDRFETTFELPGVYPYHCSAHADVMSGTIVVE